MKRVLGSAGWCVVVLASAASCGLDWCEVWPQASGCGASLSCGVSVCGEDRPCDAVIGGDPRVGDPRGGTGPVTCYALQATSRETSGALALVAVDMTTGTTRQAAQWTGAVESSFHTAGLTYGQGVYVAAGYDGNGFSWYALDPTRGEVRNLGSAGNLSAVAWTGTDWLAPLEGMAGMARYPSLEALAAHAPRCSFSGGQYSRFTVAGELIYGAWHSTDQVDVHELSTGKLLRTVQLQGWDQWVMGIAVAGGSLYLLGTSGLSSTPIAAFDLDTGAQLGQVSLPGSFSGLSCTTSPPH